MSTHATWLRLELDDAGDLALRVSCTKVVANPKGGDMTVARHEDATDLLSAESTAKIVSCLEPILTGLTKRLSAMVDVDAMEQFLAGARKGDPRLQRLSLEGEIKPDGNSTTS